MGKEFLLGLAEAARKKYSIPFEVHLDHHENIDDIKRLVDLGVRSMVIDASHHPFEENINIVKEVVDYASKYGAVVEAELGRLSGIEDDMSVDEKDAILYPTPTKQTNLSSGRASTRWLLRLGRPMVCIKESQSWIWNVWKKSEE